MTITNTAPVLSSVTMTPSTAYTDDTLSIAQATSDADGDTVTVTYDWYVDGTLVQSGSDNTLDGTSTTVGFDKDEVVYAVVTVSDGTDSTNGTTAALTIANTPPTAPVVTIEPSDAAEGDELVCEITTASTDADGDAITYAMAWTEDGITYDGVGDTADTGAIPVALVTTTGVTTPCLQGSLEGSE